jgi:superfamily II DNA or RNA helicase
VQIEQLKSKLSKLESQRVDIEKEILNTKKLIEKISPFSKQDKIKLFKSLFIGREDVYAKYWVSKDGVKKGYAPVTFSFRGKDYIPIDNNAIQRHLEGKMRIGTYAVVDQTMAKFLVLDLDKKSFIEDSRAINSVCNELNLKANVELSKSGNGIHIWFFFEKKVRAIDARRLGDILITKAMDISDGINMTSYDRMFPNQEFVAPDMLGNLVALPLHFGSRNEGKTVFIDIDSMQPYDNQWEYLKNISKITIFELFNILKDNITTTSADETSLMPWEIKQKRAINFPKTTKAVLYDALYIEKINLSKGLVNMLQRFASFLNPEFFKLQKIRRSTYKTPRVIVNFEINERYLIVPRGLTNKIKKFFNSHGSELIIEDKRVVASIKKQKLSIVLRVEQKTAFKKIIQNDYAIFIAPPGFGKTAVAAAVIAKREVNTLILVHKATLLHQWTERLSEYFDIDIKSLGRLGNGKKKLTSNIDIAILQSLKNRPELITGYSQIIVDEVHHIPAVSFEVPLKKFKGKYVLGLSATPKRQDGMHPIMFMQCGDIAHEVKMIKKQEHVLKTIKTSFEVFVEDFLSMLNEMIDDYDRNRLIVDEIEKLYDKKILLLSERIEHLNILYHLLEEKNIKSTLLHGSLKAKAQKEALKEAKSANIILSTSSYIGEGVDFSHLDAIVLTMPISFDGRIIQYLGRIGRNGQKCIAIDFVDENEPMLKNSFSKRLKGYKKMGYIQVADNRAKNLFS